MKRKPNRTEMKRIYIYTYSYVQYIKHIVCGVRSVNIIRLLAFGGKKEKENGQQQEHLLNCSFVFFCVVFFLIKISVLFYCVA